MSLAIKTFIVNASHEIIKTSCETIKRNLIYYVIGINSCEVTHNLHSYMDKISKSGVFRDIEATSSKWS